MRIDGLFTRSDECCANPPDCSACPSGTVCVLINKACACPEIRCDPTPQSSSGQTSSGGVSTGAVAGAVVGVLIFLGISIGLFIWYRRRSRKATTVEEAKPDIPAAAEDVLNRPDPMEKPPSTPTEHSTVRVYSTSSNTTIDLDPESQISHGDTHTSAASVRSNPFSDSHSIQTAGTGGTNVIPIALVSPDSGSLRSQDESARSASPVRPIRTPDMDLNLDHVNVSHDSLRPTNPKYAQSQISGISGVSSRNSFMSSASYSSDFLNEAPMIVTANKGAVRQVMGVRKAEMVNAGSLTPTSAESLRTHMARPAITSPLAATSFGPSDVASVSDKASVDGVDPFGDKHSTRTTLSPSSAGAMTTTFTDDSSHSPHDSIQSVWTPDGPTLPWTKGKGGAVDSRPSSISTQAGSVIDIASATRVNVGLTHLSPPSTAGAPRSPYRTTMGRLVTPPTNAQGTFGEQQQMALAHAQAQARAQGFDTKSRRTSRSSVVTSASVGDSILESFPFVPPSPISDRPVRSPPVSPLGQHTFVTPPSPGPPASPSSPQASRRVAEQDEGLPPPPDRRTLGLSNGSQFSTASSGLGSFPFQIDSGTTDNSAAPSSFNNSYNNGRQRASLDTLAITSDLSSYPLGFDRDSNVPPLSRRA